MLNTSRRRVNKNSLTWWHVLKTSWRHLFNTSWRRLEDVLKTYDQDEYFAVDLGVLKTSWRHILKTYTWSEYCRLDQDVLKTSSEDEDKTRLQNVFKTSSSRRMFAGLLLRACDIFFRTSWPSKSSGELHLKQHQVFSWLSIPHIKSWKIWSAIFSYITSRFACEISVTETAKIWKNLTKRKYEWARLFQLRSRKEWKPKRYRNRICILKDTVLLHIILSSIFNYHTVIEKFCILSFLTTISCSSSKILYIVASPFLI